MASTSTTTAPALFPVRVQAEDAVSTWLHEGVIVGLEMQGESVAANLPPKPGAEAGLEDGRGGKASAPERVLAATQLKQQKFSFQGWDVDGLADSESVAISGHMTSGLAGVNLAGFLVAIGFSECGRSNQQPNA